MSQVEMPQCPNIQANTANINIIVRYFIFLPLLTCGAAMPCWVAFKYRPGDTNIV